MRARGARHPAWFWLAVIVGVAAWEVLVRRRWVSPTSVAAPTEIAAAFVDLFAHDQFARDVSATAWRTVAGVFLGFPLGVLVALGLYALGERTRPSGELVLDFVRSIPITALVPLFIVIYGVGDENKVAIGAFASVLVTAITVWIGIKRALVRSAVVFFLYQPTHAKRLLLFVLPQCIPSLIAALRLAASSALVLVIVAEMYVGTRAGIGKVISDLQYGDRRAGQYAAIVCAGALGYAINALCAAIGRRALRGLDPEDPTGTVGV